VAVGKWRGRGGSPGGMTGGELGTGMRVAGWGRWVTGTRANGGRRLFRSELVGSVAFCLQTRRVNEGCGVGTKILYSATESFMRCVTKW